MTYATLLPHDDASLHWRQPEALKWRFVLAAAGDRVLGLLEFCSRTASDFTAETAGGRWRFERVGAWTPKIRALVSDDVVATLEVSNAWLNNRAALNAPDGRVIAQWVMTSYLKGLVEWQDADGAPLITFRKGTDEGGAASWWRTQCRVDFTPAGFAHPDRDLLLTIGWYFTVLAGDPLL